MRRDRSLMLALALALLATLALAGCEENTSTTNNTVSITGPTQCPVFFIVDGNGLRHTLSGGADSTVTVDGVTYTFNPDCSVSSTTTTTTK